MTTEASAATPGENTPSTAAPAAPDSSAATPASAPAPAVVPAVTEDPSTNTPEPAKAADAPVLKAPEKYEFKAPEGQNLDPSVMGKFEALAKELDLSQADAQKFVDSVAPEILAAQNAARDKQIAEWTEAAKTDKEFGGDKLTENLAIAKKALETFGTPALTDLLNSTGLGNNPEIIRAFYKAGLKISQASFVAGGQAPKSQSSNAANKLYPDMPQGSV